MSECAMWHLSRCGSCRCGLQVAISTKVCICRMWVWEVPAQVCLCCFSVDWAHQKLHCGKECPLFSPFWYICAASLRLYDACLKRKQEGAANGNFKPSATEQTPTNFPLHGHKTQAVHFSFKWQKRLNFTLSLLKSASTGDRVKGITLSWLYLPQERAQVPASLGTALPVASELSLRCCSLGWPPFFAWRWLWERSLPSRKALLCYWLMGERTRPGLFCSQHKSQCHICLWLH